MASTNFQLSIVSADQRLPSQTVDVDGEWTTIDLKRHLSKFYPGEPPVDSQKLIFAGRILSDDSNLRNVIGQESISRTVHLVLSPSVANQAKAAVAAQEPSGLTPEQMEQLKQQYLQYLSDYYKNSNDTALNDQNENDEFDNGDEVINVEIDLNEGLEVPENGFQRVARALGIGGGGAAVQQQANDVGAEEQVDLFDLAYAVFRISILIAVCVAYASWQRIALVAFVGLFFYWRNGARQNAIRQRRNPPVASPNPAPPAQQNTDAQNPGVQSTTTTPGAATGSDEVGQLSASTETPQPEQQEPPTRIQQIAQALRGAGETSYRLVYAIFDSLVPELPARID
nr:homocysteine responsive endoplasmic [Hymenolepis microstoma]